MSDIALAYVPIALLDDYWPRIADEIDAIAKRCNYGWTAASVLHEIKRFDAILYVAFDKREPVGFMVGQIADAVDERRFHVWIAGGNTLERMAEFWPLIRDIAKQRGCGAITFESPRRWEKALKFLEVRYLYREGI